MCSCVLGEGRCDACARLAYFDRPKKGNTVKAGDLNQNHIGKRFKEVPGRVERVLHREEGIAILSDNQWRIFGHYSALTPEPEYETVAAGELRPEHIGRQTATGQRIRAIVFTSDRVALNLGTKEGHRYKYHDIIHMMVED